VAATPDNIVLKRHRDLVGREWHRYLRWGLMGLVAVIPVLALTNLFGQHATTARAGPVSLRAPTAVRSGLLFGAHFTIRADHELRKATLLLDSGWGDGLTINTVEPSPISEGSRDGRFLFALGHIPAGERFDFFLQFQVNPTTFGNRDQDVELYDGSTRIARIERTLTIYP
jgi:hypothetical protein